MKCLTASAAVFEMVSPFDGQPDFACTMDSPWPVIWEYHLTTTTTTIVTTTTTTSTTTTTTTTSTADMGPVVPIVSAILEITFANSKNIPQGVQALAWSACLAALQSWIIQSLPDIAGEVQIRDLVIANGPPRIKITFGIFVLVGDTAEVASTITALEGEKESVLLRRVHAQLVQI